MTCRNLIGFKNETIKLLSQVWNFKSKLLLSVYSFKKTKWKKIKLNDKTVREKIEKKIVDKTKKYKQNFKNMRKSNL